MRQGETAESNLKPRAQRFPIHTLMYFRPNGGTEWGEGITKNISRSGVLFWTKEKIHPKAILEMRILLPDATVTCWGPIARFAPPQPPDTRPHLAAAILRYRLSRAQDPEPNSPKGHKPHGGTMRIA